jgi:uncharacterized RDD family membrane protein YckC
MGVQCGTCGAVNAYEAERCGRCREPVALTDLARALAVVGTAPTGIPPVPGAPTRCASLARRAAARVVDFAIVVTALHFLGAFGGDAAFRPDLAAPAITTSVHLLAWFGALAYFIAGEGGRTGQTVGKWLVGIRVVAEDGGPLGHRRAAVRLATRLFDVIGVGYLFAMWDDKRQSFHDKVVGALVVMVAPPMGQSEATEATSGPEEGWAAVA